MEINVLNDYVEEFEFEVNAFGKVPEKELVAAFLKRAQNLRLHLIHQSRRKLVLAKLLLYECAELRWMALSFRKREEAVGRVADRKKETKYMSKAQKELGKVSRDMNDTDKRKVQGYNCQ
jgi:hypothetical protein